MQRFYGDTKNHGPPKADTLFEIGSITKTFTATVLVFADQHGTMHIGDPLARYALSGFHVPDFNGKPKLLARSRRAHLGTASPDAEPALADAAR